MYERDVPKITEAARTSQNQKTKKAWLTPKIAMFMITGPSSSREAPHPQAGRTPRA